MDSLHIQAANQLRKMLIEGQFTSGAKLNERELALALNVSRTPLREAIKMLAVEGLVELLPKRGAIVPLFKLEDVQHTFEVIAALEGQSGELAAQRATDAEINEIRALHLEMSACHLRKDLFNYYRLNAQVHSAFNTAARNPVLTDVYKKINARLQTLRFRSNLNEQKWALALQEHAQMVDALAARDAAGLRQLMVMHLNNKRDTVLEQLAQRASDDS